MTMNTGIELKIGMLLFGLWRHDDPHTSLSFVVAKKNGEDKPNKIMARACQTDVMPLWEASATLPTVRGRELVKGRDYNTKPIFGEDGETDVYVQELFVDNFRNRGLVVFLDQVPTTARVVDSQPDPFDDETMLTFHEVGDFALEITRFTGRVAYASFVPLVNH